MRIVDPTEPAAQILPGPRGAGRYFLRSPLAAMASIQPEARGWPVAHGDRDLHD
jgi:hypothetical protein